MILLCFIAKTGKRIRSVIGDKIINRKESTVQKIVLQNAKRLD